MAHQTRLTALPELTDLVLLIRDEVPATANAFAARLPGVRVHVLGARRDLDADELAQLHSGVTYQLAKSEQARLDYLARIPRPQAIIEAGNKKRAHKLSSFRALFYFVSPGGFYSVEELDAVGSERYDDGGANVLELLAKVASVRAMSGASARAAPVMVRELAAAAGRIVFEDRRAIIERTGARLWFKLRDWESDDVLTRRYGDDWGVVLERRPARSFRSRATVTSHGEGPIPSGTKTFAVPELFFRRYHDVTCTARQIVRYREYVLPDSWRHPNQRVLNNRQLVHSSPFFGRYLDRTEPTETLKAAGSFYYFDTELPGHFGHITTDVLSRVWGYHIARRYDPTVRPLVSVSVLPKQIPGFQQQIFAALDIPVEDALIIGPREAVEVETLYAGSPQLENPHYIDPDLSGIWRNLADGLPPGRPSSADKIFISRRPSDKRHCPQTPQIERFFAREKFQIVFPEDHPYADQKEMFARARIVAGLGGSGMFNMMFAPQARVIIISGSSYNAENEHLIAAANGNDLHYFWGQSELPMPARFSLEAFRSSFSFDLRRHKQALRSLIA